MEDVKDHGSTKLFQNIEAWLAQIHRIPISKSLTTKQSTKYQKSLQNFNINFF